MRHALIVHETSAPLILTSLRATSVRRRRAVTQQRSMSSSSPPGRTYADAIDKLNTFQTPFAVIEARRKAGIKPDESQIRSTRAYWARLGHTPDDLNRLNVIHVAGTKGKGSVCAFVSSILTQHQRTHHKPTKTGLLISPHLIAVRERIRIDNVPLSEAVFARYFFEVYDRLVTDPSTASLHPDDAEPGSAPIYARYLTLLAFHVFLREGVDAAVVETGVGGEFDATNIVARPLATGVATLGVDHVYILGDTVDKIAWHKAGIMKPGSTPAFAVEQVAFPSAEAVLRARAAEKGVELRVVSEDPRLGVAGDGGGAHVRVRPDAPFQRRNASLAIALAERALGVLDPVGFAESCARAGPGRVCEAVKEGIEKVVWRGRCEVKEEVGVRWLLDGAHTTDSLKMAARWFADECEGRPGPRVLIFNQQGRTEAVDFLEKLHTAAERADGTSFDRVMFCTNVTYASTGYKRDFVNHQYDPEAIKKLTVQRAFAERWAQLDPKADISVIPSIEETINQARALTTSNKSLGGEGVGAQQEQEEGKEKEAVQVFITGSLHLVGGALGILEGADAL